MGRTGLRGLSSGQYQAIDPPGGFPPNPACGSARQSADGWAGEQALDVEAVHMMAPAAHILWYAGQDCQGFLDSFTTAVSQDRAGVISTSQNARNADVPATERAAFDQEAVQAAIQGQSVIVSSGDNGDNTAGGGKASPSWPADSPWATGVGGTTVGVGATNQPIFTTGWESEGFIQTPNGWVPVQTPTGAFAGGSGGGPSPAYAEPEWQHGIVPDRLAHGQRTTPDISALGNGTTGIWRDYTSPEGQEITGIEGGTSLSAPLVAGLVADAAQMSHLSLGLLNPWLYGAGRAGISDVTHVDAGTWSPGLTTAGGTTLPPGSYLTGADDDPQSLHTTPGYDTTTGLGTPNAAFVYGTR